MPVIATGRRGDSAVAATRSCFVLFAILPAGQTRATPRAEITAMDTHWLPTLKSRNPGRFSQVCDRINDLLPDNMEFTVRTDSMGECLFAKGGAHVPFAALSDGSRAFIGWVADMLYHICFGRPSGVKLVESCAAASKVPAGASQRALPLRCLGAPDLDVVEIAVLAGDAEFDLRLCRVADAGRLQETDGLSIDARAHLVADGLDGEGVPLARLELRRKGRILAGHHLRHFRLFLGVFL